MKTGDKVKVVSFQGTLTSVYPTEANEDYWKLIGSTGRIVDDSEADREGKVYVRFNQSLNDYNLINHNEQTGLKYRNTLFLLMSDLELDGLK